MEEAEQLGSYIKGEMNKENFQKLFENNCSPSFDPEQHLLRIGVVNQTTMLASDTLAIADYFKKLMIEKFGEEEIENHFADTRDTLCYATNDNQQATFGLLKESADLAIVVGGFNSSNTSHLVELCEEKLPTYFVSTHEEIISSDKIRHFDYRNKQILVSKDFLPDQKPLRIILTSGASCPDAVVDGVMDKLLSFYQLDKSKEEVLEAVLNT
jgi:4-hydroxy-3-methylbut-2-enyl diphosphate reductase